MGDIPGIDYESPEPVDRSSLPRHDATPRRTRAALFDGREFDRLSWEAERDDEYGLGTTGRSPAQDHAYAPDREEIDSETLLTRLWESLELPGQPSDYHFAIQTAAGLLWRRRSREPAALRWAEYLYLLDVRLIEACPEAIENEFAQGDNSQVPYYVASAFNSLTSLYEKEGFLAQALEIAAVAARFGQGQERVAELSERLDALGAEDGV
ncbi:MAG: hypothetical protein WB507_04470 [Solirubrobacterales bacterium]